MGKRKSFIGEVVSDKMKKTVVVKVSQMSKHPKYGRISKSHNKFKAHDEKGTAKTGDTVRIIQTRPLSKDKRFAVMEVLKKSSGLKAEIKGEEVMQ